MIRNIGLVCLAFALVFVQTPPKGANTHGQSLSRRALDKLREDPVVVKVVVLSEESGNPVPNLSAENFIIDEDGDRQKATHFLREERQLSILLLIDSSGSMRPSIQLIIEALSRGLKGLKPDDEVALMSFNEKVNLLQGFTSNKGLVEEKLRGVVAGRPTLPRQALLQASTHMLKATGPDSRRVIVVVTDNRRSMPTDSISEKIVMQELSASGSVVCAIVVCSPPEPLVFAKSSSDIAPYVEETGGLVETIKTFTPAEISARFVKTIDAFRHYYQIAYYPTNLKRDGKHRKIKVTLSPEVKKSGGKLKVLSRRGYYAPNGLASTDQK